MGLFDGTRFERPVTCERCEKPLVECQCPRSAAGDLLLPQSQTALVGIEKRPGGKVVTLVQGLDPTAAKIDDLLKELKARCASGGTIKDGTIQLQGDHRPGVEKALRELGFKVKAR